MKSYAFNKVPYKIVRCKNSHTIGKEFTSPAQLKLYIHDILCFKIILPNKCSPFLHQMIILPVQVKLKVLQMHDSLFRTRRCHQVCFLGRTIFSYKFCINFEFYYVCLLFLLSIFSFFLLLSCIPETFIICIIHLLRTPAMQK